MKSITLKEFCNKYEYGPHKKKNLSELAKTIGISVSYISKVYNAKIYTSSNGPTWKLLSNYINNYGYNLIIADPLEYMQTNITKENKILKQENELLKQENEFLSLQLNDLKNIIKLCERIIERNKKNAKHL